MDSHIEVVKKAIEFKTPDYLPMEILDVPGIYNAYHTLDPETVEIVPGAEEFDAMWTNCYSWFFTDVGETPDGEVLKRDQFGVLVRTPKDTGSAYAVLERPLENRDSLKGFELPDPGDLDPYYEKLGSTIKTRYPDRFIDGYIDAGIFLSTMMLMGEEQFLIKTIDNINFVVELYENLMEYYKALVLKYKKVGAHMINVIEDVGSTASMLIPPDIWRKHFKPLTHKFYKYVHEQGLYTGLLIDGNCGEILDDLLEMDIDVFSSFDIKTTGMDLIKEKLKGKICLKATVDMQTTLPMGTPEEVMQDARELVETLNSPQGGFICEVVRFHRPEYPAQNVLASAKGFNEYRQLVL
jgi:uroporphyrinogen decarboxylase